MFQVHLESFEHLDRHIDKIFQGLQFRITLIQTYIKKNNDICYNNCDCIKINFNSYYCRANCIYMTWRIRQYQFTVQTPTTKLSIPSTAWLGSLSAAVHRKFLQVHGMALSRSEYTHYENLILRIH